MNKFIGIGNLTKDPQLTTTNSGISVCKFTIAVQRKFADENGDRQADFLNVVAWRGLADNCGKYLKKGSKVAVVGAIQTRTYEVDGQKRYATDIVADEVEFLSKADGNGAEGQNNGSNAHGLKPVGEDEGLPF